MGTYYGKSNGLSREKDQCRKQLNLGLDIKVNIHFACTTVPQYGPRREKSCLPGFANNKGPDQPAHLRSLISAFVIRFLKSTICKLATGEISIF